MGDLIAGLAYCGAGEKVVESSRDTVWGEVPWRQIAAGTESLQAQGVVWLIVSHGHDELGDGGCKALAEGADPTVMHEGTGAL